MQAGHLAAPIPTALAGSWILAGNPTAASKLGPEDCRKFEDDLKHHITAAGWLQYHWQLPEDSIIKTKSYNRKKQSNTKVQTTQQ